MWQISDWFSGHIKKNPSVKSVPQVVICDVCGTWHGLCTVTSIHSIQKSTRNSQKLGNELASGWQKIQVSKQREIELISKSIWGKGKQKMFRLRSWLLLYEKQYKSCCWRTFVIRKCKIYSEISTYILLVDKIMMMKWLCTHWPTINKETSLTRPTSTRKLFKK